VETDRLSEDGELRRRKRFCGGPVAWTRPEQSQHHSVARDEFAPDKQKDQKKGVSGRSEGQMRQRTHRFVFYGWTGDAEVQLFVLIDAGIDQRLH
jgi:hypothetical protein